MDYTQFLIYTSDARPMVVFIWKKNKTNNISQSSFFRYQKCKNLNLIKSFFTETVQHNQIRLRNLR